ncbi:MAG: phosphoribosylanthranilate isomerase [Eubacterium sp.]|nr:phosphoribosylanthranilate isomerase [Eubacterium sp.]
MAKIKICGITRMEDILAVNVSLPDYIGFVFVKKSRRYVSPQQAARLKTQLSADIAAVGVFVNEAKETVARLLEQGTIDLAQLHGQETEQEIAWIRKRTGKPVIKAVSVQSQMDIARWQESCADYLLLDHGAGGSGQSFDWSLADTCKKRYFLAGGIHIGNIKEALKIGAYAIDLSGGAETNGQKDPEKIAEIVKAVRIQT